MVEGKGRTKLDKVQLCHLFGWPVKETAHVRKAFAPLHLNGSAAETNHDVAVHVRLLGSFVSSDDDTKHGPASYNRKEQDYEDHALEILHLCLLLHEIADERAHLCRSVMAILVQVILHEKLFEAWVKHEAGVGRKRFWPRGSIRGNSRVRLKPWRDRRGTHCDRVEGDYKDGWGSGL